MKNSMLASARLSIRLLTRRQRAFYILLVSLRALLGIFDVLGIAMIGLVSAIAASGLDGGKPISIAGITLPTMSEQTLVYLVVGVLAIFIVKTVAALLLIRKMTTFVASIEAEKATVIARHLLTGDLDEVSQYSRAEIQWAVMDSSRHAFTGMLNDIATLLSEGVLLILVIAMFFLVNPLATVFVALYFGAIIFIIQVLIERGLQRASLDGAEGAMGTIRSVNDSLDAYREIAVLGRVSHFLTIFSRERGRLANAFASNAFFAGMPRYVVETSLMLGVVIFVGVQFLSGQLSSGIMTIGVFLTGGIRIMASLLPMQGAVTGMKSHVGQADMAQELLLGFQRDSARATRDDVVVAMHSSSMTSATAMTDSSRGASLALTDITFSYPGAERPSLNGISMEVPAGAKIAIIGPSGAGKTTLVDVILGLMAPQLGRVSIDGLEPVSLREAFPGSISYVPQRPGLVSGSIAENVALGENVDEIDLLRVQQSLKKAHLWDFVESLPEGVNSNIGKQSDSLSGGQIQRLGLARALYVKPRLIVLDEATSALDAGAEALVSQTLEELGSDVTVIVIAHRLSTVQHSDCVYLLEDGRLTASGTFSQLRKSVPMVAEYVELMSFDD